MRKQVLKKNMPVLGRTARLFTGYDWSATAARGVPARHEACVLDPAAGGAVARRAWRARVEAVRRAPSPQRKADTLHQRVAGWAHARAPGDPCIGQGG